MVAGGEQREQRRRLGRQAAGERYPAAAALEARDALFEGRERRVHDARVGVAVLLKVEVRRGCGWVLEDVARGLKNRHRARAGIRIRPLTGVHLTGLEAELARLFHGGSREGDGVRMIGLCCVASNRGAASL